MGNGQCKCMCVCVCMKTRGQVNPHHCTNLYTHTQKVNSSYKLYYLCENGMT